MEYYWLFFVCRGGREHPCSMTPLQRDVVFVMVVRGCVCICGRHVVVVVAMVVVVGIAVLLTLSCCRHHRHRIAVAFAIASAAVLICCNIFAVFIIIAFQDFSF